MPNTVSSGGCYLIDFRSAAACVPSYKRSTQKVMTQNLRIRPSARHFRVEIPY